MTGAAGRLAAFALVLAALFGVGAVAGKLIDPNASAEDSPGHGASEMTGMDGEGHGAGPHAAPESSAAGSIRGLAVAEDGLRLVVPRPELTRGTTSELRFQVLATDGQPLREFDVEHTKRMHAIVVRRDLSEFQHLHPRMGADGTWSVPLKLEQPGSYRLFADFSHGGEPTTLATDLRVDGEAGPRPLPPPASGAVSDGGFDVRMRGSAPRAGEEAMLRFEVSEGGEPVEVQPYLGADGHLVALRHGDLAFLHVHPSDDPVQREDGAIEFMATFPTAGSYRLFLQFRVEGEVQTVAFTEEVR